MPAVKLVRMIQLLAHCAGRLLPNTRAAQITYFKAAHSFRCLDVAGGSRDNGAKVQQFDCNSTDAQNWEISYVASGEQFNGQAGNYYALINRNSGKCLEVEGWATHNGAKINNGTAIAAPASNGYSTITGRSEAPKCRCTIVTAVNAPMFPHRPGATTWASSCGIAASPATNNGGGTGDNGL